MTMNIEMNFKAVKCGTVRIKKSHLHDKQLLFGIDSDSLITKIMFVHKDQIIDRNSDNVCLDYCFCKNADLEVAIRWVLANSCIQHKTLKCVYITGWNGYNNLSIIESIFKVKTGYIDVKVALVAALKIGLNDIGIHNLTTPHLQVTNMGSSNDLANDIIYKGLKMRHTKTRTSQTVGHDLIYPCLFKICGPESDFIYFNKDGQEEILECQTIGTSMILGLGKCLLDTNIYDEIIKLAIKGDRTKVDTQTKDILTNTKDTPYGIFPPDMPLFPFGKCADLDLGLDTYAKRDIAASIIAFFCMLLVTECFHMCRVKGLSTVYMIGDIFDCDIFQNEIRRYLTIMPPLFEVEILKFDYALCLGAMAFINEHDV